MRVMRSCQHNPSDRADTTDSRVQGNRRQKRRQHPPPAQSPGTGAPSNDAVATAPREVPESSPCTPRTKFIPRQSAKATQRTRRPAFPGKLRQRFANRIRRKKIAANPARAVARIAPSQAPARGGNRCRCAFDGNSDSAPSSLSAFSICGFDQHSTERGGGGRISGASTIRGRARSKTDRPDRSCENGNGAEREIR